MLEQLAAAAGDSDKVFWTNQLVETLAAYVQEGLLPDGLAKLEKLGESAAGNEALAASIAFRLLQPRYSAGMQQPGADGEKLQAALFDDLEKFVEAHPQAPDAAEALLQIAVRDEFEGSEKESIDRYAAIITANFPDTPQARKAAGAVRRLRERGQAARARRPDIDGKQVAVESLRGVPVLVHYWSTDCEPCKVDLAKIREL